MGAASLVREVGEWWSDGTCKLLLVTLLLISLAGIQSGHRVMVAPKALALLSHLVSARLLRLSHLQPGSWIISPERNNGGPWECQAKRDWMESQKRIDE